MDSKTKRARIISQLRLLARQWRPKQMARKAVVVKVPNGVYKNGNTKFISKYPCVHCGDLFLANETDVDHIDPVVSVEHGFVDFNTFIDRLYVEVDKYQILCKPCHKVKSKAENAERRRNAKKDDY